MSVNPFYHDWVNANCDPNDPDYQSAVEPYDPREDDPQVQAQRAKDLDDEIAGLVAECKEIAAEDAKRFHDHLDQCPQCANNPFALCPEGDQLIRLTIRP